MPLIHIAFRGRDARCDDTDRLGVGIGSETNRARQAKPVNPRNKRAEDASWRNSYLDYLYTDSPRDGVPKC